MVATLQDMPVTQLYLVEPISNTGVGGSVTFYWNENDPGPFKQANNTEANDTLITEGFIMLSALKGTTGLEYGYFTSGTSNYLTDGVRQVTYTMTARGLPPTNKTNPPVAGFARNYRSHLADAMCVFNETTLARAAAETSQAATTNSTETAGEALDATSAALGVSLHTDGKYYKYHSTNYPNLQGVIQEGNSVSTDEEFTLVNLKGSSINHTGLTIDADYYVSDGGTLTTTNSSTTKFLGHSRTASILDHSLQFNAESSSDAEITAGTDTDPKLQSAAQLKLAVETHAPAASIKSILLPELQPGTGFTPTITATTALFTHFILPADININSLSIKTSGSAGTNGTFDFAVYSEDGQTKHFEETTANITATSTEYETSTSSERSLPAGGYYIGIVGNSSASKTFFGSYDTSHLKSTGSNVSFAGTQTVSSGTLPATFDPTALTDSRGLFFRLDN